MTVPTSDVSPNGDVGADDARQSNDGSNQDDVETATGEVTSNEPTTNPNQSIEGNNYHAMTDPGEYDDYRTRHWKESPFAVGKVEPTWADEAGLCGCPPARGDRSKRSRPGKRFTRILFGCAGRVGNMVVLKQSRRRDGSPRIDVCMGPHWPMNLLITYPLIIGVSALTWWRVDMLNVHIALFIVWCLVTATCLLSLTLTSFRDPGIMLRRSEVPEDADPQDWMWSDQALTQRYKKDKYDPECAVVIEGFDHT
mmetsp:Transcript_42281/g.62694  ORF Transcript_42281/g.62694 Transcript_42281/m.62694 type:complete len:253 (-) Transcript_42281:632-1390(-)